MLLLFLTGCAENSVDLEASLIYPENSKAQPIIEGFGSELSVRTVYFFQSETGSTGNTFPDFAKPTVSQIDSAEFLNWHKASGRGTSLENEAGLVLPRVPLNRSSLEIMIEFILPIESLPDSGGETQYFIVAYACTLIEDSKVTEVDLRDQLAQGLRVYTGRTCGRCPIDEAQYRNQDRDDVSFEGLLNLEDGSPTEEYITETPCPDSLRN